MSEFLKRLLIFTLPVAVVIGFLEARLYQVPTMYSKKREGLEREAPMLRGLILGTSHAVHNYEPEAIPLRTFNLSHVSQSLQIDSRLLALALPRLPKLCFVVINLSYFSFEYRLDGNDDDTRNRFYLKHYGFFGDSSRWRLVNPRYWFHFSVLGPDAAREIIRMGFRRELGEGITSLGGLRSEKLTRTPYPISEAVGTSRAAYHTASARAELAGEATSALREMLEALKRRGVSVLLVRGPAHRYYWQALDPALEASFQERARAAGAPFADYLKDERFVDTHFFDVDHLSSAGAAVFTRLVWDEQLARLTAGCAAD